MINKMKRVSELSTSNDGASKKLKKSSDNSATEDNSEHSQETNLKPKQKLEKKTEPIRKSKPPFSKKDGFKTKFPSKESNEKPNWSELKQKKKELKVKRRQAKGTYDAATEAKKLAETLRQKYFKKGNTEQRDKLVGQLHDLLQKEGHYKKFVLSHDMARIVQYVLKFGRKEIRSEIAQELAPLSVEMIQSKYGRYVYKNILKYGDAASRSTCIKALYGHAVKLSSHVISAAVFDYAYSTWATSQQKHHLMQEFYGEMYKQAKDEKVQHLKDVYKDSPAMKEAALGATKANLSRILNKNLLDSALIQSVLYQYITECNAESRNELITQLAPHVVILSNSKDGARAAMQCIWHGSNKERKNIMKAVKEHVIELSKHEHGHVTIIALLDTADDTVLMNKMMISQILKHTHDLANNEWGRKVLLWLVAPADPTHCHRLLISELENGRSQSTIKKEATIRQNEILQYSSPSLLDDIAEDAAFWLSKPAIALVAGAILKSGSPQNLDKPLESIAKVISNPSWKIPEEEKEVLGIEHAGYHMALKKIAMHDKALIGTGVSFGKALLDDLSDDTLSLWLTSNRGCFLLVAVYENGTEEVQKSLRTKLRSHKKVLKSQKFAGSQILYKKLAE